MAQALITTLSVQISAQICGSGSWNVSFHIFHRVISAWRGCHILGHRIHCARCSHFAALSQRKLTKQAGCQLPSHPVAASSLSTVLWEFLLTFTHSPYICAYLHTCSHRGQLSLLMTWSTCTLGEDFEDKSFSRWRPSLSAIASSLTS